MHKINFKYHLDDLPPVLELILLGLQWLAIIVPIIIIIGKVIVGLHDHSPSEQVLYLQKMFFVSAICLLLQLLWGHRLPLIIGPATVLLVGIAASLGSDINTIYSSVFLGGIILWGLGITGLFGKIKMLFTPQVVATILMLIAFTLAPMIMNLLFAFSQVTPLQNLCFAFILLLAMFVANKYLTGLWKTTLIIWSIIIGSSFYQLLFPQYSWLSFGRDISPVAGFFKNLNLTLSFDPGVLFSFIICYLALSINDLGSIQSIGALIKPANMEKRITRGIAFTGLGNMLSGLLGVIGPVNFSLSPGVIASTGVASRFTLIPTALGLLLLSFLPSIIAFMGSIPPVVVGSILIYIMCSQIASGLLVAFNKADGFKFENGVIMGLPLMLSIIISFLPQDIVNTFPVSLRPILGNGFVVGVLAVLILENIIYRYKDCPKQ